MRSSVEVWWAGLEQFDENLANQLDAVERVRLAAFANDVDRRRFTIGAALLRTAVGKRLDVEPTAINVDRTCSRCGAGHGKPLLPGTALHVSVTHSGALVGVAVSTIAQVGLDVEQHTDLAYEQLVPLVLADGEPNPRSRREFLRYWTRKESVVKATGDGLMTDLTTVAVTGPAESAALLSYAGTELPASMADLNPLPDHLAALTILAAGGVEITEHRTDSST